MDTLVPHTARRLNFQKSDTDIISNDSFLSLRINFSCDTFIDCRTKTLGRDSHICLSFNSKRTDLKDWGTFNGIKIFPLVGLALLEEWTSLTNDSIYWSVTAIKVLKLLENPRISLQTLGVATPRTCLRIPIRYYCHLLLIVRSL